MKRFVAIVLTIILLFSMTSALAAAPGSAGDPLISRSYIDDTFIPDVVSAGKRQLTGSATAGAGPESITLRAGKSAVITTGSTLMLTSGSAYLYSLTGAVVDCTTGKELTAGSAAAIGHRYLCAEDSSASFGAGSDSTFLIEGNFKTGTAPVRAPVPTTVVATTLKVKFNGVEKKMEVYNIDGNTYYKLRDIAALMMGTASEFSVDYSTESKIMYTYSPGYYTLVGGELQTGTDKSKSCIVSPWILQVNGREVNCYVYNLANNNFFKLRDLGDALGFGVDYDGENRTVLIFSRDYGEETPEIIQPRQNEEPGEYHGV